MFLRSGGKRKVGRRRVMIRRVTRVSLNFVQLPKEQLLPALDVPLLFMITTWEMGLQYHKSNVYGKDFSVQLSRPVLRGGKII